MGNRVRELREARAWTQAQLAEVAKISERTVQRAESGENISKSAVIALAEALEVSVTALVAPTADQEQHEPAGEFLMRVTTGYELFARANGAEAGDLGWEPGLTARQVELAGRLLDGLGDLLDSLDELYPSQRMGLEAEYDNLLQEMDNEGLWVFAGTGMWRWRPGAVVDLDPKVDGVDLRTVVIRVHRSTNPTIIKTRSADAIWRQVLGGVRS